MKDDSAIDTQIFRLQGTVELDLRALTGGYLQLGSVGSGKTSGAGAQLIKNLLCEPEPEASGEEFDLTSYIVQHD